MKRPLRLGTAAPLLLAGACVAAQADTGGCSAVSDGNGPGWQLVKGTDAKSKGEAAVFSHLKDDAKGQSKTFAAALVATPWVLFDGCPSGSRLGAATHELDLSVAANRDTTTGSEADHTALAAGLRSAIALPLLGTGASLGLVTSAEYKKKRITDGSDRGLSVLGQFNLPWLKWHNEAQAGRPVYKLVLVPLVGAYHTRTTGNTGAGARNGSYAGPVVGLAASLDVRMIAPAGSVDDRPLFTVSGSVRHQPEARDQGDFTKADYDLGELTIAVPLNLSGDKQLKPRLALSHAQGTDRMAGKTWRRQTRLELTVSYGI